MTTHIGCRRALALPGRALYNEMGDCEEPSFLFASAAEAMRFDAVTLMLPGPAVEVALDHSAGICVVDGVEILPLHCYRLRAQGAP